MAKVTLARAKPFAVQTVPVWLEELLRAAKVGVLGTAATPSEAVALVGEHQPDLLIVGLEFEDDEIDAWECLRRSRAAAPEMKMIVISAHSDPSAIELAFVEGASAYCIKSAAPADLAAAIRQSFDHSIYLAHVHALPQAALYDQASGPGLSPAASSRSCSSLQRGTQMRSSPGCSG